MSDKYKLTPVKKTRVFEVEIVADWNDADYDRDSYAYSEEEFNSITCDLLIDILKNYSGHGQFKGVYEEERFESLAIPYGYDGCRCHSLEEINVRYIDGDGKIYDVKLPE